MVKSTKLDGYYVLETVFDKHTSELLYSFSDEEKEDFTKLMDYTMDVVLKTILSRREKGVNKNGLDG